MYIFFINSSFSDISASMTALALVSAIMKCDFIFIFSFCKVTVQLPGTRIFVLLCTVNFTDVVFSLGLDDAN